MAPLLRLHKCLIALLLILLAASSLAAASEPGLSSGDLAQETGTNRLANRLLQFKSAGTAAEGGDMRIASAGQYLEKISSITLHKEGNSVTWSLAPSFETSSPRPEGSAANVQVLVRYRF